MAEKWAATPWEGRNHQVLEGLSLSTQPPGWGRKLCTEGIPSSMELGGGGHIRSGFPGNRACGGSTDLDVYFPDILPASLQKKPILCVLIILGEVVQPSVSMDR